MNLSRNNSIQVSSLAKILINQYKTNLIIPFNLYRKQEKLKLCENYSTISHIQNLLKMKNLFLLLIMVTFFGTISGQTSKGTWIVGLHNFAPVPLVSEASVYNLFPQSNALGISFGTVKEKYNGEEEEGKENTTVFGLSLNSHYFVADQFAIGVVGNYSSGSSKYSSPFGEYKYSSSIFLMGPEARYYFDTGAKSKIWLKGGASFGSVSSKEDGESNDPFSLSQVGGGAGISIFPVSAVSIDLGLAYNVLTVTQKDGSDKSQSIYSGLTFDIGFGIFFGGGKQTPAPVTN